MPAGHGVVQTLPSGLLKVSALEFVALPAKSVIQVVFASKSVKSPKKQGVINAEGFVGLRKL